MASSEEIRSRIDACARERELAPELGEVDKSLGDFWPDAVENQAVELADAISAELSRHLLQRRPQAEEGPCPQCGKPGRYEGAPERELIGRRRPVAAAGPEYFFPSCRNRSHPRQQ